MSPGCTSSVVVTGTFTLLLSCWGLLYKLMCLFCVSYYCLQAIYTFYMNWRCLVTFQWCLQHHSRRLTQTSDEMKCQICRKCHRYHEVTWSAFKVEHHWLCVYIVVMYSLVGWLLAYVFHLLHSILWQLPVLHWPGPLWPLFQGLWPLTSLLQGQLEDTNRICCTS